MISYSISKEELPIRVTQILAYEGDSKWFWFEGNFESYEKNKIDRLGADAARPHRVTYRKLTR